MVFEAHNLSLTLNKFEILKDISFQVKEKETLVLMGKNGCGKTMLLKALCGMAQPQKGTPLILGKNIYHLKRKEANELKLNIGYVFQQSGLFDSMTIAENVLFLIKRFQDKSQNELNKIATDCLNRSGLKDVENRLPSELSGGMRKRAAIARSISLNPKVMLMDDPAAGLDPVLTDAIANLIIALRDDIHATFIITTHDFNLAYKLADRIGLMVNGKLHCILPVDEFKSSDEPYVKQFREGSLTGPIPVVE